MPNNLINDAQSIFCFIYQIKLFYLDRVVQYCRNIINSFVMLKILNIFVTFS